uniref:Putative secreted protein n=1 Tax=Anopheles marajoara TaxID=58244 RepID=A0A2M4C6B4_9DIPT
MMVGWVVLLASLVVLSLVERMAPARTRQPVTMAMTTTTTRTLTKATMMTMRMMRRKRRKMTRRKTTTRTMMTRMRKKRTRRRRKTMVRIRKTMRNTVVVPVTSALGHEPQQRLHRMAPRPRRPLPAPPRRGSSQQQRCQRSAGHQRYWHQRW